MDDKEIIKQLVEALQTWENVFYPFDGGTVSVPDYTFLPEVKSCILQGRKALKVAGKY